MTADDYVARVLAHLPAAMPQRTPIATELRGHIAERLEHGQPLDAVLAQLGDPATLAESYLQAVPQTPAPFGSRFLAKAVDVLLFVGIGGATVGLGWVALPREQFPLAILAGALIGAFGFLAYTIAAEAASGRTLGKRLTGLQVLRESGGPISTGQAVVRQLPILFQVFWLDAAFILFTDRRQRAAELLSKTCVVHLEPTGR